MKLSDRLAAAQQRPSDSERHPGGAHRAAQRQREAMMSDAASEVIAPEVTHFEIAPDVTRFEFVPVQVPAPVVVAPAAVSTMPSAPDTAAPETVQPAETQLAEPQAGEPQPVAAQPVAAQPVAAQPVAAQPAAAKPSGAKRTRRRPAKAVAATAVLQATQPGSQPTVTPAAPVIPEPSTEPTTGPTMEADAKGDTPARAVPPLLDWVTISSSAPPAPAKPAAVSSTYESKPPTETHGSHERPEEVSVAKPDKATTQVPKVTTPTGERVRYVDPLAGIKRKVHQSLLDALGPTLYDAELDERELAVRVRQTLQTVMESEQALISTAERVRITNEVSDEILGHGPLEPFLRDADVTEIMVNGADQIYVERAGKIFPVNAAFTDDNHLRRTIEKIVGRVGRRIDESSPMVDARLLDGSRVNAVLPPVALDGPMLTIRKFAADPLTVEDIVGFGTITAATANLLAACVRGRLNILISGGTGSGKTTTLNVLSSFVPSNERIVTIEDAAELQLRQEHVVRMESRPSNIEGKGEITTRELVKNSLRMRPDRIIVGEVRDGAAIDMLQAMNTGHDGSLTTLHANSPRDALSRLETMVLMAGVDLPTRAIREQAASAIDLIVHQSRLRDGTRRVTHITEVTGMESDVVTLQDLFVFDYTAGVDENGKFLGSLRPTGIRPMFVQRLADEGIVIPSGLFQDWS